MILRGGGCSHAATLTTQRGRRRAFTRAAVGQNGQNEGITQWPRNVQGINQSSISADLQADDSSAPSVRLRNKSSELIAQMQKEAGEKLTLQQQLLQAQQDVMEALSREEASNEERNALQARTDRLAATLSMMEHRSSELQAELEAVQHSRQTLADAREVLMTEKNALVEQLQQQQQQDTPPRAPAWSVVQEMYTRLQHLLNRGPAQSDSMGSSEQLRAQLQSAQASFEEQRAALQSAQQSAASAQAQLSAQADAAAAEKQRADAATAAAVSLRSEITSTSDRAASAEAALQAQTEAAAAANKRAAAAEEELGRQVVAAQEALARSEAAERALREQKEEAAVRAAAMGKELHDVRHKLSTTESYLSKRMAVVASLPRRVRGGRKNKKAVEKSKEREAVTAPSAEESQSEEELPGVGHTNTNRYSLGSPDMLFDFTKAMAKREASLQSVPGYLGMTLHQTQPQEFEVQTLWENAEAFENWSYDRRAQQQAGEMPLGVFQRMPRKGEGVPDGYTPLKTE